MNASGEVLQELRDIHWPDSLPASPAAEIALVLLLGLAAALLIGLLRAGLGRSFPVRRAALDELARIRRLEGDERLAAQAHLLRRVAHALGAGAEPEWGAPWLRTLDGLFGSTFFTAGPGGIFGEPLYRRLAEMDLSAVDEGIETLLRDLRR